jgi:hypothetical protein
MQVNNVSGRVGSRQAEAASKQTVVLVNNVSVALCRQGDRETGRLVDRRSC